jgi:cytochrome c551/c552
MVKVLIAAVLGTIAGIVVMIVVIVATGGSTEGASSVGLTLSVSTAAVSSASTPTSTPSGGGSSGGGSSGGGSSSGGGDATAGKAVFASNGCGSCHTLSVAGATGTIGPDLDKVVAGDATKAHMSVGAFIEQSITDPAAFTASGGPWATAMPSTFGSSLSATQIADLAALIESGQTS